MRRTSNNRRLLDLSTTPLPVYNQSNLDADRRYDVPHDATLEERGKIISDGLYNELERGVLSVEDIVTSVAFLQPSVAGINQALAHIQEMKEAIYSITGLPSLSGPHQPPPSGEALKRIFIHFYAESSALQTQLATTAAELIGQDIQWDHIFDVIETQTTARETELMQMMSEEEDA